jgi:hypothetical protein
MSHDFYSQFANMSDRNENRVAQNVILYLH